MGTSDFSKACTNSTTSYFYSKTNKMHECIKFILFWNDTLHVSDGLSVHHPEFKTVHTAIGICQPDTAVCLLPIREQEDGCIRGRTIKFANSPPCACRGSTRQKP